MTKGVQTGPILATITIIMAEMIIVVPIFWGGEGIPTCLARLFFIFNREFRGEKKKIKLLLDMASSLWYQYSVVQPLVQPVPSRSFVRSPHGSDSSQGNVGKHHQESNKIQYPLGVTE